MKLKTLLLSPFKLALPFKLKFPFHFLLPYGATSKNIFSQTSQSFSNLNDSNPFTSHEPWKSLPLSTANKSHSKKSSPLNALDINAFIRNDTLIPNNESKIPTLSVKKTQEEKSDHSSHTKARKALFFQSMLTATALKLMYDEKTFNNPSNSEDSIEPSITDNPEAFYKLFEDKKALFQFVNNFINDLEKIVNKAYKNSLKDQPSGAQRIDLPRLKLNTDAASAITSLNLQLNKDINFTTNEEKKNLDELITNITLCLIYIKNTDITVEEINPFSNTIKNFVDFAVKFFDLNSKPLINKNPRQFLGFDYYTKKSFFLTAMERYNKTATPAEQINLIVQTSEQIKYFAEKVLKQMDQELKLLNHAQHNSKTARI